MLLEAGHIEPAVEIKTLDRSKGIARDIMAEAGGGYDALLIRRRGHSHMREVILGGITQKLLLKIDAIPLMIAGSKPANKKIMICVDGSPGAYRAVQFVGEMFGSRPDYHFRLVHVIRGAGAGMEAVITEGLEGAGAIFDKSIQLLSSMGIEPAQISTKSITGVRSRSGWIVEHASIGWNTIVVGRRGMSDVGIFHMGRVSHKIVFAGRKETVWIVN
jgi:nucleotide-binding universal stress UspA family protein